MLDLVYENKKTDTISRLYARSFSNNNFCCMISNKGQGEGQNKHPGKQRQGFLPGTEFGFQNSHAAQAWNVKVGSYDKSQGSGRGDCFLKGLHDRLLV